MLTPSDAKKEQPSKWNVKKTHSLHVTQNEVIEGYRAKCGKRLRAIDKDLIVGPNNINLPTCNPCRDIMLKEKRAKNHGQA